MRYSHAELDAFAAAFNRDSLVIVDIRVPQGTVGKESYRVFAC